MADWSYGAVRPFYSNVMISRYDISPIKPSFCHIWFQKTKYSQTPNKPVDRVTVRGSKLMLMCLCIFCLLTLTQQDHNKSDLVFEACPAAPKLLKKSINDNVLQPHCSPTIRDCRNINHKPNKRLFFNTSEYFRALGTAWEEATVQ